MTKRGERITITCAQCGEDYSYVFDRGRIRRFHPDDHVGPGGEPTLCRWRYANERRKATTKARTDADRARFEAAVTEAATKRARRQVPLSLTPEERRALLGRIEATRRSLALLLGRSADKASAQATLGHYRAEVKENLVPILDEIEAVLRQ